MNLLEQIAAHLELCGFGTVATARQDGNIHWGRMPDQPDDCICVYSTDSAYPGAENGARIQIMNRAKQPRKAYEVAYQIACELDGFNGFLGGDGSMANIEIMSSAVGVGADTKKRELYSTNIRVRYC